jgi:hypothetical protein
MQYEHHAVELFPSSYLKLSIISSTSMVAIQICSGLVVGAAVDLVAFTI